MSSNKSKILLGIVSFVPLVFIIFVILVSISYERFVPYWYWGFHVIGITLSVWITYYNVFHVFRNTRIESLKKWTWFFFLASFFLIADPIYWYLHIWKPH